VSGNEFREFLAASLWFESAPDNVLTKLADAAALKHFPANTYIWSLGEANNNVFGVMTGRVRISVASEMGQEFAVIDREQGFWLNDPCLMSDIGRAAEAQAMTGSDLLVIPRHVMLEVGEEWPQLYRNLYRDVATNFHGLLEVLAGVLFYPLRARVAGRVLLLIEEHGHRVDDGVLLDIKLSQNDFARLAMGSRQRVNRIFRDWDKRGMVVSRNDRLLIKDIEGLQKEVVPFE